MDDLRKQLTQPSPESHQEWTGRIISSLAIILISGLVVAILVFLTINHC